MHIEGTDVAQSAADTILTRPSLKDILTLIDPPEAFWKRVVFNFVWSVVYNVFALLLAAGGCFAGEGSDTALVCGVGGVS